MIQKNFLYLLIFLLIGCNFETTEESSDSLISGHKSIEDSFSIELPADGTYGVSQNLNFRISHTAPVIVSGTPEILIEVGEISRSATYISGSGTKTLTFRYTLQAGESDTDGVEVDPIINLSGGTITYSSSGNSLDATTQISDISSSEILVLTDSPNITSNIPPLPKEYREGDSLIFIMTYDRPVIVSGNPTITIDIGGASKEVPFLSGSGGQNLLFRYSVTSGDLDLDGISLTGAINLNGGTINDFASNSADLTFTPANTSFVFVNGSAPYVDSLNLPANKTYLSGEIISFDLLFSEVVDVLGGTPLVSLNIGGNLKDATYTTGSGTNTLNFQYVVTSSDTDDNGISIGNILNLNGSSIKNTTGNDAITSYVSPLTNGVLVYGATPSIVSITPPSDGDYLNGSSLDFIVVFSEDVVVSDFPRLALNIDGSTFYANFVEGSETSSLTFRYSAGIESDSDGIAFDSTSIDLNGTGLIRSEVTNLDAGTDFGAVAPSLSSITINGDPATQLAIITEPVDTPIDSSITPSITVEIRNAANSLIANATSNVTVSFGFDPNGDSVLGGTITRAAVGGVATFDDISINKLGSNFTLTVSSTGLTSDTSTPFDILPAPPTDLNILVEPSDAFAGANIAPGIQVEVVDTNGDLVTTATNLVTLSFGTDPSSGDGTLAGTLSQAAVGGIATFNNISIDKAFDGYTLLASATGLNSDTSTTFNISAATASQLAFVVEPSDAEILTNIAPAMQIEIQDAFGNKTADTNAITLDINSDPAGLSMLAGTTTVSAVGGVANFSDLNIDKAGTGFNLSATTAGLTSATSADFNITTTPVALRVLAEPSNTESDEDIAPAVVIEIIDAAGNVVTDASDVVTVAFNNDASSGTATLSGTVSQAAVSGVATFNDLSIDSVATGYTFLFTSGALTSVSSSSFDITSAAATKLNFTVEPTNTVAGESITSSIRVELLDAVDTLVTTATNSVTLSLGTDPSAGAATVGGTITRSAVAGVVIFDDINIDKVGVGYSLTASAAGLTSDTSSTFDISVAPASQVVFKVEPTDSEVLGNITPAMEVEIQDAFGNLTSSTDTITLAFANDPNGSSVLAGTLSANAVAGVATFSDLNIDKSGTAYTFEASATGLTSTTSAAFNISSTPVALRILVGPSDTESIQSISPSIQVEVIDVAGNVVTDATNSVVVDFGTDPSLGVASLSGGVNVSAVGGIATFTDLSIDSIHDDYTLTFTSSGLTDVTSGVFDITQPPPSQLAFKVEPSTAVAGVNVGPSIEVEILDANGNLVSTATDSITLSFQSDPSSGTAVLAGTLTASAVNGIASFNDINIDKAFTGYTLNAAAAGLTSVISAGFDITHSTASKLAFTTEPNNQNENTNIAPSIEVTILDTFDNIVTSGTNSISLGLDTDPSAGSAVITGSLSQSAVLGVATFSDIKLDYPASGYTLIATTTGLSSATSNPFNIFGVPAKLHFSLQPSDTEIGNNIPNITVQVLDSAENVVGSATNSISLSLISDPSGGSASFSGTLVKSAVGGEAIFSGLSLDEVGANYIITATSAGLVSKNTTPFDITLSAPDTLTLLNPASSPSDDATPTITVGTVSSGELVKLYTDSICSSANEVASFTSTATTADLTTTALAEGVHILYARRFSVGGAPSGCSTASLTYEVSGAFYQLDSFANNDFGNWSNVAGDNHDWSTASGDTPSTGVGPSSASSGTHYIYTEASSPVAANQEFHLESNILDGSSDDLSLSFDWNKRGDSMGDLILEASNNGGGSWTTVWSHAGMDVATSETSTWNKQHVDLCNAGYTSSNIKLRFRGVMPAAGTVWNSDIALDEIEVNSGGCTPGDPSSVSISTPISSTLVGVSNESSFEVSGTCSDNGENITLSGNVSGSVVCSSNTWSTTLDLSAYPDGAILINVDHTAASGGANGSDSVTVLKDSLSIQFDDMSTFANWVNISGDDDHDWSINSGDTASNGVGPTSAQGGTGNYIYTEASSPVAAGEEFIVESNSIDASLYNIKFEFYWNKRGDSMGDLHLEVSTDGGVSWDTPTWEHLGADIASSGTDVWKPETVDLCNQGYNSGNIKVRFRAVMPTAGNVWNSDIAIDSLKFTNDGCP